MFREQSPRPTLQPCCNGLDLPCLVYGPCTSSDTGKASTPVQASLSQSSPSWASPEARSVLAVSAQPSHLLAGPEVDVVWSVPTGWATTAQLHPVTVSIHTSLSLPPFPLPWVSPDQQPLLCQRKLGQPTPYTRGTREGQAKDGEHSERGWLR